MPKTYINLLPAGPHEDATTGRTFTGDLVTFENLAERFNNTVKNLPLSELRIGYSGDESTQAAGWISELLPRENGLFAKVQWTGTGSDAFQSCELSYVDPQLAFDGTKPVNLIGATMTNMPNVSSLQPLAKQRLLASPPPITTASIIINRMGMSPEVKLSTVYAKIDRINASREVIANRAEIPSSNEATLLARIGVLEAELTKTKADLAKAQTDLEATKRAYSKSVWNRSHSLYR